MTRSSNINDRTVDAVIPDGDWGWIIVFSSFMIHFIMDGITYSMGDIYLRPMMEVLRTNRAHVSTIFGILPAVTLISGPIATILVNTYGCRKIAIVGACLAAFGFGASSLYTNIWFYYIAIGIVGGLGFGLIYLPAITSVLFYFEKKRALAMGIAVCGSGLGTMIFPWIMPLIINAPLWFDYDGALLLESTIIFMCVIFGLLMIPLPHEPSEQRRVKNKLQVSTKQKTYEVVNSAGIDIDMHEQKYQLLPNQQSTSIQNPSDSLHIFSCEQQSATNDTYHVSLSNIKKNKSDVNNDYNKILPESFEEISADTTTKVSLLTPYKDTICQETNHHNSSSNINSNEHNKLITTTSDTKTVQSQNVSSDTKMKNNSNQSFIYELSRQIDIKQLKDTTFALFTISNFLTSLGFNVPYNFANDLAIDADIIENRRHWIIMSIGISNCFGRIIIGILGDRKWINRLVLYNITLIIAGLATMAAPLCGSIVYSHMIYASLFGFFSGGYVGLISVIVADLVGIDKSANALGILYLFQGIATCMGTPIVGAMRDGFSDFSKPYLWPYVIFGGSIILSGIILFPIVSILKRRQEHRANLTKH